ncbi:hypothetical protein ACQKMZ_18070 [Bacillus paramycoides]|uniref:hypothetical protein n=1 Tax=Bacillus paramycoides TaxID=2026194 RepID=UPI003D086A87
MLLGNLWGTFLTCTFSGIAHSFMPIILGDTSKWLGDWIGLALLNICYTLLFTLVIIIYSSLFFGHSIQIKEK